MEIADRLDVSTDLYREFNSLLESEETSRRSANFEEIFSFENE